MRILILLALLGSETLSEPTSDPFALLAVYNGSWTVHAEHPWSGRTTGTPDRLISRCERFTRYFTCEQTVNGTVTGMLIYTVDISSGRLHSRLITPDGLAAGRGDLTLNGEHWTYLDKPPPALKGNWSRTENFIVDHDHIRFEEYESADEGENWTKINFGTEVRLAARR